MNLFTAKKLIALRKHFSFSQEALAEKVGVSRQAISKWERGEASPDTDNLIILSKLYGISLDDLLGDKTAEEIIEALSAVREEKEGFTPEEKTEAPASSDNKNLYSNENHSEQPSQPQKEEINFSELGKKLLRIPYFLVAIIAYLVLGFSLKLWHPLWLIILTIPAYYLTAWAFLAKTKKKMLLMLPVYLYAVIIFLILGLVLNLWHPMWLIFICIPAYYWYVAFMKK